MNTPNPTDFAEFLEWRDVLRLLQQFERGDYTWEVHRTFNSAIPVEKDGEPPKFFYTISLRHYYRWDAKPSPADPATGKVDWEIFVRGDSIFEAMKNFVYQSQRHF